MGRGGHHVSHHHHYHHHRGGGTSDLPLWMDLIIIFVVFAILFGSESCITDEIKGKEKISDEIVLTDYLYDKADYFEDSEEGLVIEGLKYFYNKTGVQMVIVTQNERITDALTEKMYQKMFKDESHILIVLPITGIFGGNSVQYYWIGTNALKVVDETGMNRLFENIDNSWSSRESAWKSKVISLADLIVSE